VEHAFLGEIIALLAISVAAVALFGRGRLPPIVAYLCVGAAAGPHALGLLADSETTRRLGEIGVAFLLFTIGLEFSLARLRAMRDTLLGLGGAQVAVGTASGAVIARALDMDWAAAVVVGGALALSSTALVIKELGEQLELNARHGQLALGILLFQDLAAVPFLVLIPLLAADAGGSMAWPILLALGKAVLAMLALFVLGGRLLRPLFHEVSAARYPELFTLAALLVALAAAWLTSLLGLSLALGAFLAGLMLGETEYRHQIENDIRPFRDVLLCLFFVTVGMQLDVRVIAPYWPWVLLLLAGVVAGKGAAIALLTRAMGYGARISLRTGLVLGQGGEFGIALITLAAANALLAPEHTQIIITVIVLSMLLAPVLVTRNQALAQRLVRADAAGEVPARDAHAAGPGLREHVIVCGCGRTGELIGRVLGAEGIAWAGIDPDPHRIRSAMQRGEHVVLGNARSRAVLDGAGLAQAAVLVIAFDDVDSACAVVRTVRAVRHDLPVLVRAREGEDLDRLLAAGATGGVPEAFETALMLALQLLLFMQVPVDGARRRILAIQRQQYPLLSGFFKTIEDDATQASAPHGHLHSVVVDAGAAAVGRRLGELGLERCGMAPVAVRRAGAPPLEPRPDLVLEAGDVLVLHGRPAARAAVERCVASGEE